MTDTPEEAAPSRDISRDWAAEEAEALRLQREREERLQQQQKGRE